MTRYEVAKLFRSHWSLLHWKGEDHTHGVYFNDEYGYVIQQTYALRIKHDQPAPSVFYVPDMDDSLADEVKTDYPFINLHKTTRNYRSLYNGDKLTEKDLERLFKVESDNQYFLPVEPLYDLLQQIPNKRKRDRTIVNLMITGNKAKIMLIDKKLEEEAPTLELDIYSHHHSNDDRIVRGVSINANNLFHLLHFQKMGDVIYFMVSHDKIKITNFSTVPLEAVLSILK